MLARRGELVEDDSYRGDGLCPTTVAVAGEREADADVGRSDVLVHVTDPVHVHVHVHVCSAPHYSPTEPCMKLARQTAHC